MTEAEQIRLLREVSASVRAAVDAAYKDLTGKIRAGTPPREAVEQAMASFTGQYVDLLKAALGAVLTESLVLDPTTPLTVGDIELSRRLFDATQNVSAVVEGVVRQHAEGFVDAKKLALELYEGYGFNPTEPLVLAPGNDALPRYLREALLRDGSAKAALARAFADAQTKALRTANLRAAYTELLAAIDAVAEGAGADYLDVKLKVAFEEKMRYFANRIAQTELSRAISNQRAKEFMLDTDLLYVQWRMSDTHPEVDICDYFANVNLYGLGKGVYPKAQAPNPPAHPHCRCRLSVRLDLNGKTVKENRDAQASYFSSLTEKQQRLVAGSAAKLDQVRAGQSVVSVFNSGIDPAYQVKTVGEVR